MSLDGRGAPSLEGGDRAAARDTNREAAAALADLVRTTLGPKGMDKMLVGDGKIVVTNDGASILDRVDVSHPTAEFVLGVAESQEQNAFDGTTTAVVLAARLLAEGTALVERGLHPTTVAAGYERAADVVGETLAEVATSVDADNADLLATVGRTAITGKWDADARTTLGQIAAEMATDAYRDGRVWRQQLSIVAAAGGGVDDAERYPGLIVDTESSSTSVAAHAPPEPVEHASVALVDGAFEVEKPAAVQQINPTTPAELAEFHEYESGTYRAKAGRLAELDVDVVFFQQSVDDRARNLLGDAGILAVERTRRDELFKLARATSAAPAESVDALARGDVGVTERLYHETLGETDYLFLTGNPSATQSTLLLRGETDRIAEETKRVFRDCLNAAIVALEEGAVVPGGGASEVAAAVALREAADGVGDRRGLAVEAFADALETVPRTLAETAGADPLDVLAALYGRHDAGDDDAGFDATTGEVAGMTAAGVLDPVGVKRHAVESATEAAAGLLRVDGVVNLDEPLGGGAEHDHDHDHDHDHEVGPGGLRADTEGYPWAIGH